MADRKKQNLMLSRESMPMKDEAPQLTQPQSQFNLEQPIKLLDAPPLSLVSFPLYVQRREDNWGWVGGGWVARGVITAFEMLDGQVKKIPFYP